ncbi:MAG: hypothetical protein LBS53_14745 [Synergistaceae bacterium]|nr:hypothetical protein [Synergistaceae bacterium]
MEHIPWIEKTESGTPLFSDALLKGQDYARSDVVAFVNSDIILFDDFVQAIEKTKTMHWKRYLLIGQRMDCDFTRSIDFSNSCWQTDIRNEIERSATLHPPTGKDYFIFPKGTYEKIPPFAIGRMGFDCWMVSASIMKGFPVADMTDGIFAVHQNHDYRHFMDDANDNIEGYPEVKRNRLLMEPYTAAHVCSQTVHATWMLKDGTLKRRFSFCGALLKLFAHVIVFNTHSACYDMAKLLEMSREIKLFSFWESVELNMPRGKTVKEKLAKFRLWKMIRDTKLGKIIRKFLNEL